MCSMYEPSPIVPSDLSYATDRGILIFSEFVNFVVTNRNLVKVIMINKNRFLPSPWQYKQRRWWLIRGGRDGRWEGSSNQARVSHSLDQHRRGTTHSDIKWQWGVSLVCCCLTYMFIVEIGDEGEGGGETEDEPRDDPVEDGSVLRVLNPLNLVITRKKEGLQIYS